MSDIVFSRLVCGEYASNVYILRKKGADTCVLIDAGDDFELLKGELERLNLKPTYVLLTHGHFDHMLSAGRIRSEYGARVYIHKDDAFALSSEEASVLPAYMKSAFTPISPDAYYTEGGMTLGGFEFFIMHTPGHSPGCVCLSLAGENVLFTGDTLFASGNFGRTDMYGGDWGKMYSSLKMLLSLDGETEIYPGHGDSDTIKTVKERFGR